MSKANAERWASMWLSQPGIQATIHDPHTKEAIAVAIRALATIKTGKWNFIGDNMFECTSCGVVYTTNQLNGLRNYETDPYAPKFCPSCGANMKGE